MTLLWLLLINAIQNDCNSELVEASVTLFDEDLIKVGLYLAFHQNIGKHAVKSNCVVLQQLLSFAFRNKAFFYRLCNILFKVRPVNLPLDSAFLNLSQSGSMILNIWNVCSRRPVTSLGLVE